MYTYENMQTYSLENVLVLRRIVKSLIGYYWCYPENYEEEILINPTQDEIEKKYKEGIMIGKEKTGYIPHLYEGNIICFNTGVIGTVVEYEKDEQHLSILTRNERYCVSLFDGDLYYKPDSNVWVDKIGVMTGEGVFWTWERGELPEDISMEELGILMSGMVIML